jgi:hypothetical protein
MRRSGSHLSGLFFALLALVAQLAFDAAAPDIELPLALHEAALICHAPSGAQGKTPPAQHHHVPVSVFCPLWTALTAPAPLLTSAGPLLPAPSQTLFRRPGLPPLSAAPPSVAFRLAQPRAPPVLA